MKWTSLNRLENRPAGACVLSPEQAGQMLDALDCGESIIWYSGYLPIDRLYPRSPEFGMTRPEWKLRYARERAVEKLAQFMLHQAAPANFVVAPGRGGYEVDGLGRGQLSQRRLGPLFYEYVFTRTS